MPVLRLWKWTDSLIPTLLAVLAALLTLGISATGFLDALELYTFNLRCQWRPPRHPGEEVFLLVVDEGSVQNLDFGRFPWSRQVWALLHRDFIQPLEPRSIVYDILFDQPDSLHGELVDSDARFAAALAERQNAILAFSFLMLSSQPVSATESRAYDPSWRPPPRMFQRFALDPKHVLPGNYLSGASILRPLSDFEAAAPLLGYTNTPPDRADGITRRFPLVMEYAGAYYPSLPLAAVCHYLKVDLKDVHVVPGRQITLPMQDKQKVIIPIDRQANLLLNYYDADVTVFPSLSIAHFLQAHGEEAGSTLPILRDRIILIGSTALSTHDLRPVTVNDLYPLVGNVATAIANILRGDYLQQTDWGVNGTLFVLIAVLFTAFTQRNLALLRPYLSRLPSGLIGLGIQLLLQLAPTLGFGVLYSWCAYYLLSRYNVVIPMFYGLFCLVLTYLMVTLNNFASEEKTRRWLQQTWGRYMSPEMIRELQDNPEQLNLGGEERQITLLFSDICGFTPLAERLTPQQVVQLLNEYFSAMVEIVHENRGMLDKFIGDAIMVHFGSPRPAPDDALRAVRTGLQMQRKMEELALRRKEQGLEPWHIRVGINTGSVVAGNIGSPRRQEYTAIGDTVNTAQRLEANCPPGGVLISRSTYDKVREHVKAEALEPMRLKGKAEPLEVFLVIGLQEV